MTLVHMLIQRLFVILFDYYLITAICETDTKSYFNWPVDISGNADTKISADEFLHIFCVSNTVHNEIKNSIDKIIRW